MSQSKAIESIYLLFQMDIKLYILPEGQNIGILSEYENRVLRRRHERNKRGDA
jgi:hypothetical protein